MGIYAIYLYVIVTVALTLSMFLIGNSKLIDKLAFFAIGVSAILPAVLIGGFFNTTPTFLSHAELWGGFNLLIVILIAISQFVILAITLIKKISLSVFVKYIYQTHIAYLICFAILTVLVGLAAVL